MATARPATAPQTPMARPRRSGGKILLIMDRDCGDTSAPPTAWTRRARMSAVGDCASPASTEPVANTASPAT
jgi:hypothetical protein